MFSFIRQYSVFYFFPARWLSNRIHVEPRNAVMPAEFQNIRRSVETVRGRSYRRGIHRNVRKIRHDEEPTADKRGVLAGFVLFLSGIKRRGLFIPLIVIFVIRIDDGKFGNGIYFRNLPRKYFVNG